MLPEYLNNMNREKFESHLRVFSADDAWRIMLAYDLAKAAHKGQMRKDKVTRYFDHPVGVALIHIVECGERDADVICADLLHDTNEDSPIWGSIHWPHSRRREELRRRLTHIFNARVAKMVMNVTKPHVENIEIPSKGAATDVYLAHLRHDDGSLYVKMGDRLYNLRTLENVDAEGRVKQIRETREILIPMFTAARKTFPKTDYLIGEMEAAMAYVEMLAA